MVKLHHTNLQIPKVLDSVNYHPEQIGFKNMKSGKEIGKFLISDEWLLEMMIVLLDLN